METSQNIHIFMYLSRKPDAIAPLLRLLLLSYADSNHENRDKKTAQLLPADHRHTLTRHFNLTEMVLPLIYK